jgi:hypothetical protein
LGSNGLSALKELEAGAVGELKSKSMVPPQAPSFFQPREREREKQASRDADEYAMANGVSAAAIEAKNGFLRADRVIVHWPWRRSKAL